MRFLRWLASWALALFLVFMFLQATLYPFADLSLGFIQLGPIPEGQVKLFDAPGENIVFATIAQKTGLAIVEPTGRVVVALLELVAALLLFLPWTRKTGAVLAFLVLAGAVAAHLVPDILGREVPLSLKAGETETDAGALFSLAVAMLTATMLLLVVHPGKKTD